MDSWKRFCPDFKFIRWDETNSPIKDCLYVQRAYESGKWAFVSDYVRIYALFTQGGVYLDTDVELCKPLDPFLFSSAFLGLENTEKISTCIIGAEPHHKFLRRLLYQYKEQTFCQSNGDIESITNVEIFTRFFLSQGWKKENSLQEIYNVCIYPIDFFSPKNIETGKINITKNTVAIHYFQASWMSFPQKLHTKIAQWLGPSITRKLKKFLKRM